MFSSFFLLHYERVKLLCQSPLTIQCLAFRTFFITDSITRVDVEWTLNVPLVPGAQHSDSTGSHTVLRSPPAEPLPVSMEHCRGAWPLLSRDDDSHQ